MVEEITWTVHSVGQLHATAGSLLSFAAGDKIFLISGPMGAGKTTFIKSICEVLGTTDHLSSPTFSIVNEYRYRDGKIFHFDLYRLKESAELSDLGVEEYLDSGEYCFVEWPELIIPFIDGPYVEIQIIISEDERRITAVRK